MQQGTFMRWFLTWFVVWLLAAVVLLCLGAGIRAAAATGMAQGACATEPRFAAPSVLKLIHHSDAASRIILRCRAEAGRALVRAGAGGRGRRGGGLRHRS